MELDLQSLFGLHVYSCTHWLRPRNHAPPTPIWAHIRGRYWSAKIDDISLWPPGRYLFWNLVPCHLWNGRNLFWEAETDSFLSL
jgi:hypothetical protein